MSAGTLQNSDFETLNKITRKEIIVELFYSKFAAFRHETFLKYRLRYSIFPKNFFNSFIHILEHLEMANSIR